MPDGMQLPSPMPALTGLPEVRPEVVALWLGSDPMAAGEAGRLPVTDQTGSPPAEASP
jgi:hypothetical protein